MTSSGSTPSAPASPVATPISTLLFTMFGWLFIVIGIILFPTPGPGLYLMFLGLLLLSRRYTWARRLLAPARRAALYGASHSVQTWFRITQTVLTIAGIAILGVVWLAQPPAPSWWPVSDFWWLVGGIGPGFALLSTALLMSGLLTHSLRTYRDHPFDPEADRARRRPVA